jgi:hypothetical protein
VRQRRGNARPGRFQSHQAVGLGGKGIGVPSVVELEKARLALAPDPVAIVDAPARSRRGALDAELSLKFSPKFSLK